MINEYLTKEALNRLVNLGGVKKELRCPNCEKYTEHVSVSWGETESKSFYQVILRAQDFNPLVSLGMGNPFACTTCGCIRAEGGLLSDVLNKRRGKRGLLD